MIDTDPERWEYDLLPEIDDDFLMDRYDDDPSPYSGTYSEE